MRRSIDFYFDFLSPYAYLAHHRLHSLAQQHAWTVTYRPIDLAQAKLAIGNTGPTNRELPVKHRYLRRDLQRWAELYGLPFVPPAGYGSERLNRGAFFAIERGCEQVYVTRAWSKVWGEGRAMNEDALLLELAASMGWAPQTFLRYTESDEATRRLDQATDAASRQGIFGVPTMAIDDEMWWGNDRLDFVERRMASHPATSTETE